jgi:DNA-binding XRE family transcriptional regulator
MMYKGCPCSLTACEDCLCRAPSADRLRGLPVPRSERLHGWHTSPCRWPCLPLMQFTYEITSTNRYDARYMALNAINRSDSPRPRPVPPPVRRTLRHVADDVTAWRKLRGLTQAQVADRSDVSRNTVARLERGDGGVSLENLLRVLRALGVLGGVHKALDPYETDIGRLRAGEQLPRRVRPRSFTGRNDA